MPVWKQLPRSSPSSHKALHAPEPMKEKSSESKVELAQTLPSRDILRPKVKEKPKKQLSLTEANCHNTHKFLSLIICPLAFVPWPVIGFLAKRGFSSRKGDIQRMPGCGSEDGEASLQQLHDDSFPEADELMAEMVARWREEERSSNLID